MGIEHNQIFCRTPRSLDAHQAGHFLYTEMRLQRHNLFQSERLQATPGEPCVCIYVHKLGVGRLDHGRPEKRNILIYAAPKQRGGAHDRNSEVGSHLTAGLGGVSTPPRVMSAASVENPAERDGSDPSFRDTSLVQCGTQAGSHSASALSKLIPTNQEAHFPNCPIVCCSCKSIVKSSLSCISSDIDKLQSRGIYVLCSLSVCSL
jgi:hypothetical protein